MAKVFPFHATRFDPAKIKDVSAVVTQPYDKITQAMQDDYYKKSDRNIVRITKGRDEPGDDDMSNKYTRAAEFLDKWMEDGTFTTDKDPAIYAYYQDYQLPNGERRTRKGFVAMCELMEYGQGGVKPHEKTLAGPKADRLNLLRATQAHFGQIFMLYSDPQNAVNDLLDEAAAGKPLVQAVDGTELHRVWAVTDPEKVSIIQQIMDDKPLFIADGHHRYETALNYRNEMRAKGFRCDGLETFERAMMTFVNMDDKGLTVFPTHRLIFDVADFDPRRLLTQIGDFFDISDYKFDAESEEPVRREFLEDVKVEGMSAHCLGMYVAKEKTYHLLTLKDENDVDRVIKESKPRSWKALDVNILHLMILEPFLKIGPRELEAQTNVHYERYAEEALGRVKAGEYQVVFIMNPTRVSQVKEVALAAEKMPQKSTDFYPKLLTGLVFAKLNIVK
jgi:uncharacterized protein (DUF1015 family)